MNHLLPEITVCGQIDFSQVAFQCWQSGSHFDEVISIWDKGADYEDYTKKVFPDSDIEFFYFDDDQVSASLEQVEKCITRGLLLQNDERLLIHCQAGLSRSPAIALGILYVIYEDVDTSIEELQRIRPQSQPNRHIVELIDQALKLNGELTKAVQNNFYA